MRATRDSINPAGWEMVIEIFPKQSEKNKSLDLDTFLPLTQIRSWAGSTVSVTSLSWQVVLQSQLTSPQAMHFGNWVISSQFIQASPNRQDSSQEVEPILPNGVHAYQWN